MARKLKVFSADLGFVRAVVAAPSRKAALDAWGVHDDLFARGSAREIADDEALIAEATAKPGEVLRKTIASGADIVQSARRPPSARRTPPAGKGEAPAGAEAKASKPPPSRAALDEADVALKAARAARSAALHALDDEQAELARRRAAEEAKQDKAVAQNQSRRDEVKTAYDKALKAWSG